MLGADKGGNVFVGPTLPFGMANPGPDYGDNEGNAGWEATGPLNGFSQLHVSGTGGGPKYGNILVQPMAEDYLLRGRWRRYSMAATTIPVEQALVKELLLRKSPVQFFCLILVLSGCASVGLAQPAVQTTTSTSCHPGFHVDVGGVISRSDVVLGRPNFASSEAMPLGNGRVGVALWSADGLTVQLNRNDTLPDRLSPGQVVIPGFSALTRAGDYAGRLDLYSGEFREQGGEVSVKAFVQPDTDALVVDGTGANPNLRQTVVLKLWAPGLRAPWPQDQLRSWQNPGSTRRIPAPPTGPSDRSRQSPPRAAMCPL